MKQAITLCALVAALASPALADEVDLARRNRTTQIAQATSRQETERRTLEEYIRLYGHQGLNDTQIANFYIPMMQQSVYETLRGTNVREVTPENFDRMVYGDTRPKILFSSRDTGDAIEYSRGLAPVVRAQSIDFGRDVVFLVLHIDKYERNGVLTNRELGNLIARENMRGQPNIIIYANFDLTGRTSGNRMRQIDILYGGPNEPKDFLWYKENIRCWILSNFIEPQSYQNKKYVGRFNNSRTFSPIWVE
ncbi:MAG: hypothetical protein QW331_04020 [Candidatus Woesearchaeota archaeon]